MCCSTYAECVAGHYQTHQGGRRAKGSSGSSTRGLKTSKTKLAAQSPKPFDAKRPRVNTMRELPRKWRRMKSEDLKTWIQQLAGAYAHMLDKVQLAEYLDALKDWKLTPDQWHELKLQAKRKYDFFPRVSELELMRSEVLKGSVKRTADPVWETVRDDEGRAYAKRPGKGAA